MVWTIARKEIQLNVISSRFIILSLLCIGLFVVTAFTLFQEMELNYEEFHSNVASHKEAMLNEPSLVSLAGISGVKIDRRPEPLGFFAKGIEAVQSRIYRVTSYGVTPIGGSDLERNPILSISGALDFLYLFQVVLSLLAFLLICDAVSGEKESGTLKLLISHNVPRHTILLGKFVGSYITLLIPLLLSVLAVGVVMLFYSFHSFGGDDWKRIGMMLVLSGNYLAVILAAGLLISSLTKKSSLSFLTSVVAWVILIIAIPKLASHIGATLAPPPSVGVFQNQMRAITNEADVKAFTEMRKYMEGNEIPPSKEWFAELGRRVMAENNAKKAKLQQQFDNRLARTFRISSTLSRLSPSSSYAFAVQDMAGTGFNDDRRFRRSVAAFKEEFSRYMEMRMKAMSADAQANMPQLGKRLDLTGMPMFGYRRSGFAEAVGHITLDVLILLVFGVIFFLAAYLFFVRYDAR